MEGAGVGAERQHARGVEKEYMAVRGRHRVHEQRLALHAGICLGKALARAKALEDAALAPRVHALQAHAALQHQRHLQRQIAGAQMVSPAP